MKAIYNLGFGNKFHFETSSPPPSRNPPKYSFSMVGFPIPLVCSPHPITTKTHFLKSHCMCSLHNRERDFSSWQTLGSSWCYFLPVESELGYISPNREVNKAQRSHRLETSLLLKSFNEKHKGKVLAKKKKSQKRIDLRAHKECT